MNDSSLASSLKTIGLTDYQARSLIALMTLGAGTPRDVARESGIPYPSAYDSLRALSQNGWVEFASTRPSIFRIRKPASMREKITNDMNELFGELQKRYDSVRDDVSQLALIFTIIGREHVQEKLLELLDSASSATLVVLPSHLLSNSTLIGSIRQVASRSRVKFRLITDSAFEGSDGIGSARVRIRDSILAIDLLIDRQRALIGLPDLSVCGWVDSPIISSHFAQFLDLLWKDSRLFKSQ